MLVLPNVTMESSDVIKKNKGTIKFDKIYDVGTKQCEDGTVKCEKKKN